MLQNVLQGCSPATKDTEGRTALHHAVMRGHLGCVDLLLGAGQPGLLLVRDILGCTPVHLAALQNQVALITRLVDALLRDGEGVTPLHEVARRRCMQVCNPGARLPYTAGNCLQTLHAGVQA